jgi:hypothetical protein
LDGSKWAFLIYKFRNHKFVVAEFVHKLGVRGC